MCVCVALVQVVMFFFVVQKRVTALLCQCDVCLFSVFLSFDGKQVDKWMSFLAGFCLTFRIGPKTVTTQTGNERRARRRKKQSERGEVAVSCTVFLRLDSVWVFCAQTPHIYTEFCCLSSLSISWGKFFEKFEAWPHRTLLLFDRLHRRLFFFTEQFLWRFQKNGGVGSKKKHKKTKHRGMISLHGRRLCAASLTTGRTENTVPLQLLRSRTSLRSFCFILCFFSLRSLSFLSPTQFPFCL